MARFITLEALGRIAVGYPFAAAVVALSCITDSDDPPPTPPSVVFPDHHAEPDWSAQGLIVFYDRGIVCVAPDGAYSVDANLEGLWIVDPATGTRSRVVAGRWSSPDWSPDGMQLAFSNSQVFVTLVDQVDLRQITFEGQNFFPAWSPGGDWIAFDSNYMHPNDGNVLWLIHPDGTDRRDISQSGTGEWRMPSWSPDGSRIIHIRYPGGAAGGAPELYSMDPDGGGELRLTNDTIEDYAPEFSPDGTRVAWSRYDRDGVRLPQIWLCNSDGSSAYQLTTLGGADPSWSPDGKRIVYLRTNWRSNGPRNGVLWIRDLETGEDAQLTTKWPEQCN